MKKRITSIYTVILALCLSIFASVAWSEPTATQDAEDVLVAREILNQQQKSQPESSTVPNAVEQPKIANDLAEGQLQRDLPSLNQPVIDQAGLLTNAEQQALSQQIQKIYAAGQGQIGVVIVPSTGQEAIFDFAMRTAEKWRLGSAERDNGLLIAVAVNDRRIQILTGYGLEGVLPDIMLSRIIHDQITPYFKQAQYAQGISAGIAEIERILTLDPELAAQAAQELKDRQEQAFQAQKAKQATTSTALIILIAGVIASFVVGRKLSASTAAVAGTVAGLVNGMGILWSLLIGLGIFFLIITTIAQILLQAFASGAGRSGGGGGFGGGGGYSGGGGGFGGGGASGSW